jgi:TonB family protein
MKKAALLVAILFFGTVFEVIAGQAIFPAPELPPKYDRWLNEEVVYIITAKEKDVFFKLTSDRERDSFVESFWKVRDPIPGTPLNEFKEEHYRRLKYANENFGTGAEPGWRTRSGRNTIILGEKYASGWAMKMRIFEGIKEGASEPIKVVTSSFLQYRITATIQTEFDLAEEQKQIRKTFNLKEARLLTEADFSWPINKYEKTFHMFRLDGKEYLILITPVNIARKPQFRIEVFEQSGKDKTNLLNTEFSIPEKNIAVFGFEDKQGKPYFVSFRILGWTADRAIGKTTGVSGKLELGEEPVRAIGEIKAPRIIKRVDPVFPEDARRARVEGVVILEATTDIFGRVKTVKVLRSIPMLDQAAMDAVRQWIYEPIVINGRPREVIFTTSVTFQIEEGQPSARAEVTKGEELPRIKPIRITSEIQQPKMIKQVEPVYPQIARQARVEGTVILEATTDIYGRVQDVKILRSIPLLDQAAVDAVKQWVYEPFLVNGKPREVSFTTTVVFELDKDKNEGKAGGIAGGVVGGVEGGVEGGVKGGVEAGVAGGVISKEEGARLMRLPPIKVDGGIEEPQKLKSVDPVYPEEAKKARIQGEVILEVEIDIYGQVKNIKVLRSIPALDGAAMDAVRQWVYQPFIVEGRPRRAIFPVTVNFVLNEFLFFF